jgi:hypothetical protein
LSEENKRELAGGQDDEDMEEEEEEEEGGNREEEDQVGKLIYACGAGRSFFGSALECGLVSWIRLLQLAN